MTTTATAAATGEKPFVGLAPFTEGDALYFFGRDADRAVITSNLAAARLTVLYGPSGCGKTSLLDAGVAHEVNRVRAPRQIARRGTPEFVAVTFRGWRDEPRLGLLARVREAVEGVLGRTVERPPDDLPLADVLGAWAERLGGTLLIVLDQFEEYFLYHGRKVVEGTFAHELAETLNRPDLRANFLISIREDALAQLDAFEGHVPTLLANTLRLDRLDKERGRETIEGPIQRYNELNAEGGRTMTIEPDLIDEVLKTVETGAITLETAGRGRIEGRDARDDDERPIETAYLQLVMARLWEEEAGAASRALRLETFRRLGGAEGIVRSHLDTVLGRLDGDQGDLRENRDGLFRWTLAGDRRVAEEMLTFLVTSSGTKIALDPGYLAEKTGESKDRVTEVLDRLSSPDCRVLRKVEHPGQDLASYEIFHDVLARVIVDDYVPRVRLRKQRNMTLGLAAGLVLALALVVLASWQSWIARTQTREAEKQAQLATSRQLAALSETERNSRLDRSLLLAAEALRTARTSEARDSLYRALLSRPEVTSFLDMIEGYIYSVAFSPDGKALAAGYGVSGGGVGGVVLYDVAARTRLQEAPLAVAEGNVNSVAFGPDGKALAAGYSGGVVLWDVDLESWLRRARQIANRNFTRDEWRRYFPGKDYRPTFDELSIPPDVPPQGRVRSR